MAEIPEEVKALKARIAEFVREELHPFEAEIAERGEIDEEKLRALRNKARRAGFSNLNMPTEYGGMDLSMVSLVALEEESGKVTNGLGYMVADRGPRELLELASPEQIERYVMHDPYASKHVELRLNDCLVPEGARLGSGGDEGTKRWFSLERLMIAARCCGAAERLIDLARSWSLERSASGKRISDYQAIQFMLADSATALNAARLMVHHVAGVWDLDAPSILHGKTAMAKLFASEMAGRVADRAVQIFGGRGYMTENPAERYFRELRVDRIWEGTSEIQRSIIARGLLKRGREAYTMGG